mmetsp:Transcript_107298/g.280208  ORF Transcript_107298/g.280208 Transcript_107298/m.280208 type:complete len:297 (-) Transcript_107298:1008-1898(-)
MIAGILSPAHAMPGASSPAHASRRQQALPRRQSRPHDEDLDTAASSAAAAVAKFAARRASFCTQTRSSFSTALPLPPLSGEASSESHRSRSLAPSAMRITANESATSTGWPKKHRLEHSCAHSASAMGGSIAVASHAHQPNKRRSSATPSHAGSQSEPPAGPAAWRRTRMLTIPPRALQTSNTPRPSSCTVDTTAASQALTPDSRTSSAGKRSSKGAMLASAARHRSARPKFGFDGSPGASLQRQGGSSVLEKKAPRPSTWSRHVGGKTAPALAAAFKLPATADGTNTQPEKGGPW